MRALGTLLLLSAACAGTTAPLPKRPVGKAPTAPAAKPAKPRTAAPPAAPMKVVEVTVFKDGHVLVRQEATAIPREGEVVLDGLPIPVFGSYHPYARGGEAKLAGVVAASISTTSRRPATDLAELLGANPGARVRVVEVDNVQYEGTLQGLPVPTEVRGASESALRPLVSGVGSMLLRTAAGQRLVPLQRIRSLTFLDSFTRQVTESRDRVRLRMRVRPVSPAPVTVGAEYLQKGIRWLPGYRIDLNGRGTARTRIQATIVNELADLVDAETHLVIGVPQIFNEQEVDPIALFERPSGLSARFRPDAVSGFGGSFGGGVGGLGGFGGGGGGRCGEPPECGAETEEANHEDLFYLPPLRLTLKKGETLLLPLREVNLEYADLYTVEIPFTPAMDQNRARGLTADQRKELAPQLYEVRAQHQLRFFNHTDQPLTTGAASVFREGRLAAQTLVQYTPVGSSSLCLLGEAPEIKVSHEDREVSRKDLPVTPEGKETFYTRIGYEGTVSLENLSGRTVEVETVRNVPGNPDTAPDAEVVKLDEQDSVTNLRRSDRTWVNRLTGSGRLTWKLRLRPGERRTLPYTWHAFRS